MAVKNYGAGTSGYLDPEGRAWETTVFQAGKPILDKELQLVQDTEQNSALQLQRRSCPSGWVSDQFLNSSLPGVFNGMVTTANTVTIPSLTSYVNGWMVNVSYTGNNTGINQLDLGAGPAGAGAKRTDLVVLEVWRRLIGASPATAGKSAAGRIWRNGNVKVPSADDLTLNYADDILDGLVGSETTKRTQIQYRLRVITGVDLYTYQWGINDPIVVANSVPAAAASPDGVATVHAYANQSANGDSGLWRAGNGDPSNTLGTVDGYMYAVPLCAVFRRNTTAFNRNTNHNGGVAHPGPSDRPDGFFSNIIEARDVLDLRSGVAPTGWNLSEVLQKNLNFLFDNVNQTEIGTTLIGGGVNGHTIIWADEIGVSNANGGDGVTTGDTPGAEFIGEFDAVRRTFSDRVIYETVVLKYVPADGSGGGPNWAEGDEIAIDPSALPIWPYSAFNWAAHAPSNISIVEITRVALVAEVPGDDTWDSTTTATPNLVWTAFDLGEVPQGSVTLRLDAFSFTTCASALYVTVVIAYPAGVGLTKTPTTIFADNATAQTVQGVFINNPGQLPAGAPVLYSALNTPTFTPANREVSLTYTTVSHTFTFYPSSIFMNVLTLPERAVNGTVSVTVNAAPYGGSVTLSSDGYNVTLGGVTPGDTIVVTYQSIRPLPQNDEQLTVYYEARLPQTVREALLGTSRPVIPRFTSDNLYCLTAGSGTDGLAFPFPFQYVQVGGVYPGSGGSFAGDHELDGSLRVSIPAVFMDTGFMQLSTHLPVVPLPEDFVLGRAPGDVDIEGRSYFKQVTSSYKPFAVAPTLSDPKKHKNLLGMICELPADSVLGFKGQLVLVVLSRWASFDDANSILFNSVLASNTTTASIYRLKGNLLSNRRI